MRRIFLLTFLLTIINVGIVIGGVTVEYSSDNATWFNATDVQAQKGVVFIDSLEEGTLYYFRVRNDTSGWSYITQRTVTSGEKGMSSLSITGFMLLVTFGLFALPWLVKRFTDNEILDTALKGICYTLGLFLLSLSASTLYSLSATFSLGVGDEIFTFMWLIMWASYITMAIVVLGFLYKVLQLWALKKENKRMGMTDEEG